MDASHAPDYVLVTTAGTGSPESLTAAAQAILLIMDEVVGPGRRFCPIISDVRQWNPGPIKLPFLQATYRTIFPRLSRLINIMNTESRSAQTVYVILHIASAYIGGLDVVRTMDEALAKLGLLPDKV